MDEEDAPPLLVNVTESEAVSPEEAPPIKVPITIVTGKYNTGSWMHGSSTVLTKVGYLGAGKTTLLNYILTEQHGKKIAVILNGKLTLHWLLE